MTYVEGDLLLKNVKVADFADNGADKVEFRLAFNQHSKALINVYDIYRFTFPWS
jgi:hypothetical protein